MTISVVPREGETEQDQRLGVLVGGLASMLNLDPWRVLAYQIQWEAEQAGLSSASPVTGEGVQTTPEEETVAWSSI